MSSPAGSNGCDAMRSSARRRARSCAVVGAACAASTSARSRAGAVDRRLAEPPGEALAELAHALARDLAELAAGHLEGGAAASVPAPVAHGELRRAAGLRRSGDLGQFGLEGTMGQLHGGLHSTLLTWQKGYTSRSGREHASGRNRLVRRRGRCTMMWRTANARIRGSSMADKAKDKKKAEASEKSGPLPGMSAPPAEKSGHHKKLERETYEAELEKLQVELQAPGVDQARGAARRGHLRGPRRGRQGRHHQARDRAPQSARGQHRRPGDADGARAHQWYFQRYVEHLPSAGEMVLFDRSWYNRPGVERVMGFCTEDEVWEFFRTCPEFERMLIRSGIILLKYWFSVSDEEQEKRFQARLKDPLKVWKLSPMDLQSRMRWVEYSQAKDEMFAYTDTKDSPWWVVNADDKRRARLNMIHHLLGQIPYEDVTHHDLKLAERPPDTGYVRPPIDSQTFVPEDVLGREPALRRRLSAR